MYSIPFEPNTEQGYKTQDLFVRGTYKRPWGTGTFTA